MDQRVTVKLWHRSLDANSVNIEQSQFHSYVQFHFTQRVEMNVSAGSSPVSLCNWRIVRASVTWRTSYCALIFPPPPPFQFSFTLPFIPLYFLSNAGGMIDGHFVLTSSIEFRLVSVITSAKLIEPCRSLSFSPSY